MVQLLENLVKNLTDIQKLSGYKWH